MECLCGLYQSSSNIWLCDSYKVLHWVLNLLPAQFCLDSVLGLLSRSFSNSGWVAIFTRLSSPITYALGFRSSRQKFKMPIVRMHGLRFSQDFNNTEGLCLFPTSVGWSVCDSRSKAFQSNRNWPFLSLLQTHALLRTYPMSMRTCPNLRQMNGLGFPQGSPITSSSHCICLFLWSYP